MGRMKTSSGVRVHAWAVHYGNVYASETKYADEEGAMVKDTTLIDLTADGGPKRELTLPGFLQNVARVR